METLVEENSTYSVKQKITHPQKSHVPGNAAPQTKNPALEFVQQTGGRIQDAAVKLQIRRRAATTKGGKRKIPVIEFSLEVPDGFDSVTLTPRDCSAGLVSFSSIISTLHPPHPTLMTLGLTTAISYNHAPHPRT